ncbi:MAG: hypothetical protein ACXWTP_03330 [Methylosarcina sp.]
MELKLYFVKIAYSAIIAAPDEQSAIDIAEKMEMDIVLDHPCYVDASTQIETMDQLLRLDPSADPGQAPHGIPYKKAIIEFLGS